ncbi:MAG: hypothetical protein IPG92_09500 [Flavobacteriales bacterium]|nr:hypothetical protein [Flavobacteriales bacterium]
MEERQAEHEIKFLNVDGYKKVVLPETLRHDFPKLAPYEFDGSKFPLNTELGSAFSPDESKMRVEQVLQKRHQEIIFLITGYLIRRVFGGEGEDEKDPLASVRCAARHRAGMVRDQGAHAEHRGPRAPQAALLRRSGGHLRPHHEGHQSGARHARVRAASAESRTTR